MIRKTLFSMYDTFIREKWKGALGGNLVISFMRIFSTNRSVVKYMIGEIG